jgi:hypothetical protein
MGEALDPRLELAFKEAAWENLGIYCRSTTMSNGKVKKRTQFQEGWNAAIMTMTDNECVIADWFRTLSVPEQTSVKAMVEIPSSSGMYSFHIQRDDLDKNKSEVILFLSVNDTFYYACADAEEISLKDLSLILPTWREYGYNAVIAYTALKREQPPLQPLITDDYFVALGAVAAALREQA